MSSVSKRWNNAVYRAVKQTSFVIFADTDDNTLFFSLLSDNFASSAKISVPESVLYTEGRLIQWERSKRTLRLLADYERKGSFSFDVVLKVRPDLFFFSPLPHLLKLSISATTIFAPIIAVRGDFVSNLNLNLMDRTLKLIKNADKSNRCAYHAGPNSAFDCVTINDQLAIMGRKAANVYFDFHNRTFKNPAATCFVLHSSEVNITSSLLESNVTLRALDTRFRIAREKAWCGRNSPCLLEREERTNAAIGKQPLCSNKKKKLG